MKNTKVLYLDKKPIDKEQFRLRSAAESDYQELITESTVIMDGDRVAIVYLELDGAINPVPMVAALHQVKYDKSTRTNGMVTTSRTFGFLPRNPVRQNFCRVTDLAVSQPREHAVITEYAESIARYYRELNPELYQQHERTTAESVVADYTIKGSVFTSGIINKNNPLKYHFDTGNFKEVWSCMLVFKRDIEGGYLSCPEFGVGFELKHNSLLMFDGQQIIHGVTPIRRMSSRAYRYSVVYYSMRQMWNCEPLGAELKRIQNLKTQKERKRARFSDNVKFDMRQPVQHPIFIVSKGRWKRLRTAFNLRGAGVPYTLVVEPGELERYREEEPNATYLVLPEDNQGIRYARQYLLDHCRQLGLLRYWQIDDNIDKFCYTFDKTSEPITPNAALGEIEKMVAERPNVALAATDYLQFGVLAERDYTTGTRAYCCVLTRTDTGIDYRQGTDMKEDVDFTLQHLAAGYDTLLSHRFVMAKPKMGGARNGGLAPLYRAGKHNQAAQYVHSLWADRTTLVDKGGSLDVKVDWSAFRKQPA